MTDNLTWSTQPEWPLLVILVSVMGTGSGSVSSNLCGFSTGVVAIWIVGASFLKSGFSFVGDAFFGTSNSITSSIISVWEDLVSDSALGEFFFGIAGVFGLLFFAGWLSFLFGLSFLAGLSFGLPFLGGLSFGWDEGLVSESFNASFRVIIPGLESLLLRSEDEFLDVGSLEELRLSRAERRFERVVETSSSEFLADRRLARLLTTAEVSSSFSGSGSGSGSWDQGSVWK